MTTLDDRLAPALAVADSVLFEGYLLYPYRASAGKNQSRVRWQFGVLTPRDAGSEEPSAQHTECLLEPGEQAVLDLRLRFLHARTRSGPGEAPWDEGEVRQVDTSVELADLDGPRGIDCEIAFEIPGGQDHDGPVVRECRALAGVIRLRTEPVAGPYGLCKLAVTVENRTRWDEQQDPGEREVLLRHSLISAHTLFALRGGAFVSLLEPPEFARPAAESCGNRHVWPVLVGEQHRRDLVLSSPIILYDYPEIAPESPGDLCDATEIDEILTLRTMALTEREKDEARATDDRAAAIIDQVDNLPPEMLDRLHGAVRYLRGVTGEAAAPVPADGPPTYRTPGEDGYDAFAPPDMPRPETPWWDPGSDASVSPETDSVAVLGGLASRGSKVRLLPPRRRADAHDMFYTDRIATVQAVLFDVDGSSHVAVTVDDDPAADMHQAAGRFLYYSPEEVELVSSP